MYISCTDKNLHSLHYIISIYKLFRVKDLNEKRFENLANKSLIRLQHVRILELGAHIELSKALDPDELRLGGSRWPPPGSGYISDRITGIRIWSGSS